MSAPQGKVVRYTFDEQSLQRYRREIERTAYLKAAEAIEYMPSAYEDEHNADYCIGFNEALDAALATVRKLG